MNTMKPQSSNSIRPDVLITALASRLSDLQGSRIDTDTAVIIAPTLAPDAGRRGFIAALLINALEQQLEDGKSGFVPMGTIQNQISESLTDISLSELQFVARFLDVDREIGYDDVIGGQHQSHVLREQSRLIRYQSRLDRVKLTNAGKMWLRIVHMRDQWLFEDKEVEKLGKAINGNLFDQIPMLASGNVTSLRLLNEKITHVIESPSFQDLASQFFVSKDYFSEMISNSNAAVVEALDMMSTPDVSKRFMDWAEVRGDDVPQFIFLVEHVRRVHRVIVSVNDNWNVLLELLAKDKRSMVGVIRFDQALDRYLSVPAPIELDHILLDGIGGWGNPESTFSIVDVIGSLPEGLEKETRAGPQYDTNRVAAKIMKSWLSENERVLASILKDGQAHSLFEMMHRDDISTVDLPAISAVFGVYVMHEPLGKSISVQVIQQDGTSKIEKLGHNIVGSNIALKILEGGTR